MQNPKMSSIIEGLHIDERQKSNQRKREAKFRASEIEKEREKQGAPKDAEFDAETGYFMEPGQKDIYYSNPDKLKYWNPKSKSYTLFDDIHEAVSDDVRNAIEDDLEGFDIDERRYYKMSDADKQKELEKAYKANKSTVDRKIGRGSGPSGKGPSGSTMAERRSRKRIDSGVSDGEHWVTIGHAPVLVDGDGTIKNEKVRKSIETGSKKKVNEERWCTIAGVRTKVDANGKILDEKAKATIAKRTGRACEDCENIDTLPVDEDRWVTMRGTHVLVDDKGGIKNEKLRKTITANSEKAQKQNPGSGGKSEPEKKEPEKKEPEKKEPEKKEEPPKVDKKKEAFDKKMKKVGLNGKDIFTSDKKANKAAIESLKYSDGKTLNAAINMVLDGRVSDDTINRCISDHDGSVSFNPRGVSEKIDDLTSIPKKVQIGGRPASLYSLLNGRVSNGPDMVLKYLDDAGVDLTKVKEVADKISSVSKEKYAAKRKRDLERYAAERRAKDAKDENRKTTKDSIQGKVARGHTQREVDAAFDTLVKSEDKERSGDSYSEVDKSISYASAMKDLRKKMGVSVDDFNKMLDSMGFEDGYRLNSEGNMKNPNASRYGGGMFGASVSSTY